MMKRSIVIIGIFILTAALAAGQKYGFVDTEYIRKKIIKILDDSIYPGLQNHLLFSFTASPLSIEDKVRSSEGAIVGWSFDQPIPVKGSMINMKKAVKTAFPDVYKAGQWAGSPAGLPTCILTAKLVPGMVKKELT